MALKCTPEGASSAMKKCPFLHNIAQTHGEGYANSLLNKPACPFGHGAAQQPILPEDYESNFGATFALFHGKQGILPLPHISRPAPEVLYPVERPVAQQTVTRPCASEACSSVEPRHGASSLAGAPFASMSMSWGSNWFNIHHLFQQHLQQHRSHHRKPPQQPQPSPNAPGGVPGPGPMGGPGYLSSSTPGGSGGTGGKCPLRRALGPLAGMVFNKHGQLSCPEPIVKMRAALAATRPVRELRPQALPIKLLAVAMTTAALNVPCGMWREHTEKFSSQWFVAVHATIPFIAMLRKAVIMPKYAILFTICAAIAGQAMGAKLERKRMLAAARTELEGLAKASLVAGAAPTVRAAQALVPRRHEAVVMTSMEDAAVPLPMASLAMAARQGPCHTGGAGLAAWVERDEGERLGMGVERKQRLQFGVSLESGRRVGGRKGGGVALTGARGLRSDRPAIAMLPTPVAC